MGAPFPLPLVRKNSRSPGARLLSATGFAAENCSAAVRGATMPICSCTYCTSPLQSNVFGPAPPHLYGAPSSDRARIAISLPTEMGGAGGGVSALTGGTGRWGGAEAQPCRIALEA